MKRWAVVIFKSDNSLDWFSVYGENKKEAKENVKATIEDHFYGAKIVRIIPYDEYWGIKNK